jgi:hypothetical protein
LAGWAAAAAEPMAGGTATVSTEPISVVIAANDVSAFMGLARGVRAVKSRVKSMTLNGRRRTGPDRADLAAEPGRQPRRSRVPIRTSRHAVGGKRNVTPPLHMTINVGFALLQLAD